MKTVGIVAKTDDRAEQKADEFEAWLRERNICSVRKENPSNFGRTAGDSAPPSDLLCVFVLGGDGTFLSAVRWIGDRDIPIIGVKFGQVGFLAEIAEKNLFVAAEKVLAGTFSTFPRMRLLVRVTHGDEEIAKETVLNDVVINKGTLARLANIKTYIDDVYLTTYRADGLILATPTGSTAYSLAAGGPVVHPAVPGIIMTPICPFTLTNRPLIVPNSVSVTIRLVGEASDIMLTFDGQAGLAINGEHTIVVEKSPHPIRMIMIPDLNYFDLLKAKLRWSGGRV